MRTPSGSTSGIGTSRISNGLPGPKKTAALRGRGLEAHAPLSSELEGVVEGAHGELGVLVLDDAGDGDLGGGDHLDVDAFLRQRREHAPRHAGVAAHAHADDRDLGHPVVGDDALGPDLAGDPREHALGALPVAARQGERDVGQARRG